jgi:multidrug resistance efflux pump
MLPGVRCAMVLLGPPDSGPFTPVAVWPDAKLDLNHLTGAAERCLKERRGLLVETETASTRSPFSETHHVAYPIEVSEKLHGVVVLGIDQADKKQVQQMMRQLHWGAAWLEVLVRRKETARAVEGKERLQKVLDLVASAVEHEDYQAAAMALVTRVAAALDCDRVSLGVAGPKHARVEAVSNSASFGRQSNLVRAIEAAMDEAVDQRVSIVYPLPSGAVPVVTRDHVRLVQQQGSGAICTVPMDVKEKIFGALTLERPADRPFDPETLELCETVAAFVGPIMATKRADQRWLIAKVMHAFSRQLERFFGPGYLFRKLAVIGLAAAVVFFSLFRVDYRVTAPTVIEGTVQRVVAAPFNGFVIEAPVRPGDVVEKGALLCLLDDRELELEHLKWLSERDKTTKQYQEAMARHERAKARILKAKIDQAVAQISLMEEQMARARIVAPFDSVVMSGDLSQSLGTPVDRGQELFTVTPLDSYRVVVEVDERDIVDIRNGQKSELVLPSIPGEVFPFVVEKITPVSIAKEGRNYFRVEGRMEQASGLLRPGMEGVGKVTVDRRKLIWVWTHEMVDWLRLQLWRWFP